MKQKIEAVKEDASVTITWKNQDLSSPDFVIKGLEIECDGDSMVYGCLAAIANYINDYIEIQNSKPQVAYSLEDIAKFNDENGLANCRMHKGEITKIDKQLTFTMPFMRRHEQVN